MSIENGTTTLGNGTTTLGNGTTTLGSGATGSAGDPTGAPIMSLDLVRAGTTTVVTARGEVDMSSAGSLVEMIGRVADSRPDRVVLELSGVTFFSAHGITALLRVRDIVREGHGELFLRGISPSVTRVLALTGLLFEWEPGRSPCAVGRDLSPRPAPATTGWRTGNRRSPGNRRSVGNRRAGSDDRIRG
ncbi:STAS domain-containing protein [Micromonospora sp. WMMD1102]|uniref:STAS domain-containing protein n=1 Tax=Micromonospora sp. WMMD1102 TaxID=3016105 RepID=UPI0024153ED3|nr:STAS domain-containing protein [Micromonospora sp. WMMD1102]MDG4786055.1 STAS domain-containing protein [Micromonospora sp. WMMD1102]